MTDTVEVKAGFDSLPDEMVINVLSLVDADSLLLCRLVTRSWTHLIDKYVFQDKASKENTTANNGKGFYSFSNIGSNPINRLDLPWYVFYAICKYDPFNRNLVKNHCGQNGFVHWNELLPSLDFMFYINQGWAVEKIPKGAPMLPDDPDFDGHTSCFVTSAVKCSKKQHIIIKKHGLTNKIMQYLNPDILVSEWFCSRIDSGSDYSMEVIVYDDNNYVLDYTNYQKRMRIGLHHNWTKVSHTFKNLKKPYCITFYHSGVNTILGNRNYGTKISGSVVKVLLPLKLKLIN